VTQTKSFKTLTSGVEIPGLGPDQARLVQRFGCPKATDPVSDTIGFFVAKFVTV